MSLAAANGWKPSARSGKKEDTGEGSDLDDLAAMFSGSGGVIQ